MAWILPSQESSPPQPNSSGLLRVSGIWDGSLLSTNVLFFAVRVIPRYSMEESLHLHLKALCSEATISGFSEMLRAWDLA